MQQPHRRKSPPPPPPTEPETLVPGEYNDQTQQTTLDQLIAFLDAIDEGRLRPGFSDYREIKRLADVLRQDRESYDFNVLYVALTRVDAFLTDPFRVYRRGVQTARARAREVADANARESEQADEELNARAARNDRQSSGKVPRFRLDIFSRTRSRQSALDEQELEQGQDQRQSRRHSVFRDMWLRTRERVPALRARFPERQVSPKTRPSDSGQSDEMIPSQDENEDEQCQARVQRDEASSGEALTRKNLKSHRRQQNKRQLEEQYLERQRKPLGTKGSQEARERTMVHRCCVSDMNKNTTWIRELHNQELERLDGARQQADLGQEEWDRVLERQQQEAARRSEVLHSRPHQDELPSYPGFGSVIPPDINRGDTQVPSIVISEALAPHPHKRGQNDLWASQMENVHPRSSGSFVPRRPEVQEQSTQRQVESAQPVDLQAAEMPSVFPKDDTKEKKLEKRTSP
ncbi:hypothetical protein CC78DRAFT_568240 [Lojkania enalia]|uniref:Uncharacterized protein n=1 Tax=Lojkania enalia TaxID=147567 RepID=A0A9P4KBC1_9PLEO|nr:hypothetical protein CC78DRAFT_568240 [Didymosphaeria enalia]